MYDQELSNDLYELLIQVLRDNNDDPTLSDYERKCARTILSQFSKYAVHDGDKNYSMGLYDRTCRLLIDQLLFALHRVTKESNEDKKQLEILVEKLKEDSNAVQS